MLPGQREACGTWVRRSVRRAEVSGNDVGIICVVALMLDTAGSHQTHRQLGVSTGRVLG